MLVRPVRMMGCKDSRDGWFVFFYLLFSSCVMTNDCGVIVQKLVFLSINVVEV